MTASKRVATVARTIYRERHMSNVAYAASKHREWLESWLAGKRAREEARFEEAVANQVCAARHHTVGLGHWRKSCKDCRSEVAEHLAVVNGERMPL